MNRREKELAGLVILAASAAALAAVAGKELYTFAIARDNEHGLMMRMERAGKRVKARKAQLQEWKNKRHPKEAILEAIAAGGENTAEGSGEVSGIHEISQEEYDRITGEGVKWFMDQNPDEVTITSHDDLLLHGCYLPAEPESNKTMLLMHGYRVNGIYDLAYTYRHFHEAGYNLMVPDQRAHGKSEGLFICYGTKECYDVKNWCEYLVRRLGKDQTINLMGISMGAATVLMSTGLNLPEQVNKVIADCGFTSPQAQFESVLSGSKMPGKEYLIRLAEKWSIHKADFGFSDYSTLDALEVNQRPVLFIHGTADDFVPVKFTEQNYRACKAPKAVLYVEGAKHATSGLVDPEAYFAAIDNFLSEEWTDEETEDTQGV